MSGTTVIALLAVLGCLLAVRQVRGLRDALSRYDLARAGLHDRPTRLLAAAAMSVVLDGDMQWASMQRSNLVLVMFRVHGRAPHLAGRALHSTMRAYENGFVVVPGCYLAVLQGVDRAGAIKAISRLAAPMLRSGNTIIDVGTALYPEDGASQLRLLSHCRSRTYPIQLVVASVDGFVEANAGT